MTIEPAIFCKALAQKALKLGFAVETLELVDSVPILAFRRPPELGGTSRHLYLSSGVHGDEPAGPLALERLIDGDHLPRDAWVTVLPLINPSGISRRTRENAFGIDLNRDFRYPQSKETAAVKAYLNSLPPFDLSIALHEDWESDGFYMYALSPNPQEADLRKILDDVSQIGPIESAAEIDGSPADRGLISRPIEGLIESRDDWPEAFLLYSKNKHIHLTLESPSKLPIDKRIAMHTAAVRSAIDRLTAIA